MKRFLLSGLAALAILATSLTPASAATYCTNADGSGSAAGTWPGGLYTQYCAGAPFGSVPADATALYDTLVSFGNGGPYSYGTGPYLDATFRTLGMVAGVGSGDKLYITYTDATVLGGASPVTVGPVTVGVGDTPAILASNLANAINMNGTLSGHGMTASSEGNLVFQYSTHTSTTYSSSATLAGGGLGAAETLTTSGSGTYGSTQITMTPSTPLTFYLFDTQATYIAAGNTVPAGARPAPTSASDIGITPHNGAAPLNWTVLFEQDDETAPKTIQKFGGVSSTTMHELGHQLDLVYSSQGVLSGPNNYASDSDWAKAAVAADWAVITDSNAPPCAFNLTVMGSTWDNTGIFSYLQDQNGNYICTAETDSSYGFYDPLGLTSGNGHTLADYSGTGGPNYFGMSNAQVVYAAFSQFFDDDGTEPDPSTTGGPSAGKDQKHNRHEIFAENFALWSTLEYYDGNSLDAPAGIGGDLQSLFLCATFGYNNMFNTGQVYEGDLYHDVNINIPGTYGDYGLSSACPVP